MNGSCAAELPPECRRGADSDAYGVPPLPEPLVGSLHDALCRVRDPRGSNRVFHIGAMLTLLVMGVMAGHRDLKPVVKHCAKLTQRQRVALGLPRFDRKGGGNYRKTPGYTAFYSLRRQLPPDDFAAVLGAWIRAHEGELPRQLALDGKFIRDVAGLVRAADLSNALVSADALHCRQETVREITLSGGEALVQGKGSQKSVLRACQRVAAGRAPLLRASR